MKIAKVVGNVISSIKNQTLFGLKLMRIKLINEQGKFSDQELIAVDYACSGEGDYVVVIKEGAANRLIAGREDGAFDVAIIGILDDFSAVKMNT